MAIENDYGQLFCEAVDLLVEKSLKSVKFDSTILCTITDDTEKEKGIYRVKSSDGQATFLAYSEKTNYAKNDNVYVQIPNGDMNEQKFIVAKKTKDTNIPLSYKPPFASFINVTGNLVTNTNGARAGLIANKQKTVDSPEAEAITIWGYNIDHPKSEIGEPLTQYARLGLQAQFCSWLDGLNVKKGTYGLRLRIEVDKHDIAEIENLTEDERNKYFQFELATKFIDDTIYYIKDENGEYQSQKDITKDNFKPNEYYIRVGTPIYYEFELNSDDMVGNPYSFNTYYQQEKVFNIDDFYSIKKMELQFFQNKDFYNQNNELIEILDSPNLFVKDVIVSLGYDMSEFTGDEVRIFTLDSPKYDTTADPPDSNHKSIEIRWIHKFENGDIRLVTDEDELDYEITWYKYRLGTYSHTPISGADWKTLSNQYSETRMRRLLYDDDDSSNDPASSLNILDSDWLEYNQSAEPGLYRTPSKNKTWLIPDITLAEESIKAILTYLPEGELIENEKYLISNRLDFTNRKEVVSKPTVAAVTALQIYCEDESDGNYQIYDQGGNLINKGQNSQEKKFIAYFEGAPLKEAEYIEWIIPISNNSMVSLDDAYLGASFTEEIQSKYKFLENAENNGVIDGFYHIYRFGDSTQKYDISFANSQRYKIKTQYKADLTDNVIQCRVVKNKITYTATKKLNFGLSGTSGTDHTFTIDFAEPNVTAIYLPDANIENNKTLYTIEGKLSKYGENGYIDLKDKNLQDTYKINWSIETAIPEAEKGIKIAEGSETPYQVILQVDENKLTMDQLYILKATLTWRGKESLIAYKPLPIKKNITNIIKESKVFYEKDKQGNYILDSNENKIIAYTLERYDDYSEISGPTEIIYHTDGSPPFYDTENYKLYKNTYIELDNKEKEANNNNVEIGGSSWRVEEVTAVGGLKWKTFINPGEATNNDQLQRMCPTIEPETNFLLPLPLYIEDAPICGVQGMFEHKGENGETITEVVWTQPLLIIMNKYPNGAVNKWSGEGLLTNEDEGSIIGAAFAAGRKETDNTFSGVMLGDWASAANGDVASVVGDQTGVYGFHFGQMSYAFMENGTAFIGKSNRGRIYFDGEDSQIYSAGFVDEKNKSGMMIDLGGDGSPYIEMIGNGDKIIPYIDIKYSDNNENSSYITLKASQKGSRIYLYNGTDKYIDINSGADTYPLKVGKNFSVEWNGDIMAHDGEFHNGYFEGELYSETGNIGGWKITSDSLQSSTGLVALYSSGKIEGAEIVGGTITGSKIKTNELYAGTASGFEYKKSIRSKEKKPDGTIGWGAWTYVGLTTFTEYKEKIYYGVGKNAENSNVKYEYVKDLAAEMNLARLGAFTGAETTHEQDQTWVIGIKGMSSVPLVLESLSNMRFTVTNGTLYVNAPSIKFTTPSPENQEGIYARFA